MIALFTGMTATDEATPVQAFPKHHVLQSLTCTGNSTY